MSAKAIREASGKDLLNRFLNQTASISRFVSVDEKTNLNDLANQHPWLLSQPLVVKPDQLIKRRGKLGLVKVNVDLNGVKEFINSHMLKDIQIGKSVGKLRNFIIEPFVKHTDDEEAYVCIYSHRNGDTILFHHQGGVDIGDVDAKALKLDVSIDQTINESVVKQVLLPNVTPAKQDFVAKFVVDLYRTYIELYFTYLEINPLVVTNDSIYILDLAAKLDATAEYLCKPKWGEIDFPPPFGRDAFPEEAYIADLDSKSGATGGGASVIYADTICELGGSSELANYGEYSGAPSEQQTYEYAKTILSLMTKERHPDGKILLIGGGIANFTNVAATFKGIVKALREFQTKLVEHGVSIFVRRAGPNFQEGLRIMRETGNTLGVPVHVFGPETHMTAIVAMALKRTEIPKLPESKLTTANFVLPSHMGTEAFANNVQSPAINTSSLAFPKLQSPTATRSVEDTFKDANQRPLFSNRTKAIIWGMQSRAVQSTLDFDFACSRKEWSVVAMIYPFTGDHKQKFYWGHKEILIPVYKNMSDAMKKHPDADVLINFASLRSAYDSTIETLQYPQIRSIAIIAEGIPENLTRKMIRQAHDKGVTVIGPATVGGIKPGCFKIGNTGGMMDNLLSSKLHRPGSVAYVSRSGGMSNELNNIISRSTNGVYEGVAIGGDRYPGTTFLDHLIRYERDPDAKMMVLLGEVGGIEEYEVCKAIKEGQITKPLVAWCIGTCAGMFNSEVQFGHAGACANSDRETATAKNRALREVGAYVPNTFDDLGNMINQVYEQLVVSKVIIPQEEVPPPTVPMDYDWARELGIIRKPASFMTSICDERGNELTYAGIPITRVIKEELGIGGTLSLLWFQRRMPTYATKFFEMVLMVTADHGPAVSGAHNTIVCARAGKDLVSSLVSGLLTIGERFGGALDASARQFSQAYDSGTDPHEFVNQMRKKGELIMGIGHRIKSINNPDMRVKLMKDYVKQTFPIYSGKPNLILNVDGIVAVSVVDLLRNSGCFTREEAQEYLDIGVLNGLFVLGRTIGFIGHYLDQKRLKQGLYRHPWDDISYILPEQNSSDNP
ncbi:hypothetical protein BLOT_008146 [Blomia tropicalis]|nr:hypothetical protein BLOT_008146 [Blomia tropicalis]